MEYLEAKWAKKEINNLQSKIIKNLELISLNPYSFSQLTKVLFARKMVVDKNNYLVYEVVESSKEIRILDFGSTRKKPTY